MNYLHTAQQQKQVEFEDLPLYLNKIDDFRTFCSYTHLKSAEGGSLTSITFQRAHKAIEKALKKLTPIRVIKPLKTLCKRLLGANQGLTVLHTLLVKLCYQTCLPRQAQEIMKTKALPKKLARVQYAIFSRYCGLIYIQLGDYARAYRKLKDASMEEAIDIQEHIDNLKKIILLSLIIGARETPESIKNSFDSVRILASVMKEVESKPISERQMLIYIELLVGSQPSNQQLTVIREDGNFQLYSMIPSPKQTALRNYIRHQLMGNNYRIRGESVKDVQLNDFKVLKAINYPKALYKYDCKEKSAIFVHDSIDQAKVSQEVTDSMNAYQEVCKNRYLQNLGVRGMDMPGVGMGMGGFGNLLHRLSGR